MTTPSPEAVVQTPPARMSEISTFDQALDQRRRTQAMEGSMPNGLLQLSEMALRISDRMRVDQPAVPAVGSDVPSAALAPKTQPTNQGAQPTGEDLITRAERLIDSSFGYAVLTQQLVRGANQVASGMTTLLRST